MERALINAGQQYKNEKNFTGDQAVLNPSVGISNPFIKEGKEKAQGILLAKSDIEMSSVSQQITSFINHPRLDNSKVHHLDIRVCI